MNVDLNGVFGMSDSDCEDIRVLSGTIVEAAEDFEDTAIVCIDCVQEFIWTAGEQAFFRDKMLQNPPKRCKECKKAKNKRLEAIEAALVTGKRHRIEVRADCARCGTSTTVPFYPCQGRPVYCRTCYLELNAERANGAGGSN
ncbi:MAG: zinc-ribbon domain containing protein [Acidobacteriota bacterium]